MKDLTTLYPHPVKFLCDWDNGHNVEIHTLDSLFREYRDTNLFDSDLGWYRGNGRSLPDFCSVLIELLQDKPGVRWGSDNMQIERIFEPMGGSGILRDGGE
tara:strand:+ start:213 stop:515 length:303 start_codon:yes stop_codon:yes gene_type:complete